jgi:hypothetical protein
MIAQMVDVVVGNGFVVQVLLRGVGVVVPEVAAAVVVVADPEVVFDFEYLLQLIQNDDYT